MTIRIKQDPEAKGLPLPQYATSGSSGMDLVAAVPPEAPLTLLPGERALVSTGIRVAVPCGFEAQVRARSGLALEHGIALVNAPGTIDSDYRGVVRVLLINLGLEPFTIRRGDRIAQVVVLPVARARTIEVSELGPTSRNDGGFGSTGVSDFFDSELAGDGGSDDDE